MGADEKYAGIQVRCQKCNQVTLIPETSQTSEAKPEQKNIIKFRCPNCNQKIGVKAEYAGRKVGCAKCRKPIIIPSPAVEKAPAEKEEIAAVPTTGTEEPFEKKSWDDFSSDFNELLEAEQGAPAVEVEKTLKLTPEETPAADFSADETQFIGTQAIEPKKRNYLIPALVAVAFVAIISTVSFIFLPKSEEEKQAEQLELSQAQTFAEDYVGLLEKKEVDKAKQLLGSELQSSSQKIAGIAERVAKGPILQITPSQPHIEKIENKKLYYFQFTLCYSEPNSLNEEINWKSHEMDPLSGQIELQSLGFQWINSELDWQSLILVVTKTGLNFQIDELALHNYVTGSTASVGDRNYEILFRVFISAAEEKLDSFLTFLAAYACILIAVLPVFYTVMVVSLWFIFDKSGESRWAAFIPVYNLCVLGKVANRPIWYGLLLILASFIPHVGRYAWAFFWIDISFGVSNEFDRGVLFTIGMIFLPYIFFPILAFTD
jgi:hypothetical protein